MLGCQLFLFYNGMEDTEVENEEAVPVWISRQQVEDFEFQYAQQRIARLEEKLREVQGSAAAVWVKQLRKDARHRRAFVCWGH